MNKRNKEKSSQQRTKGNVKPSSSDKAAKFLIHHTGGLGIPFNSSLSFNQSSENVKWDSSGKLLGFVPIPQEPDASGLDIRILNVLKRLDKKDTMTKQKSLHDFIELLKSRFDNTEESPLTSDSFVGALSFWPRIYIRLSSDSDRKVRELVQLAMHNLAEMVGKEIVICLKHIFPTWVFATVDTYEPPAQTALSGLKAIFPGSKLGDAHRLYAKYLIDLFETRISELKIEITNYKPNSNTKTVQLQNKFIPELAIALRYLSSFIDDLGCLPADHKQLIRLRDLLNPDHMWKQVADCLMLAKTKLYTSNQLEEFNVDICNLHDAINKLCIVLLCSNPNGWIKWLKENDEGIKLAKYICLLTVGNFGSPKLKTNDSNVEKYSDSLSIFYCSEKNFGYVSTLWEATLVCFTHLSSDFVWSVVDWRNSFVPGLDHLLTSGKSNAKQLYSNLLCLLNSFPLDYSNLSDDDLSVLNNLFIQSCLIGLKRALRIIPNDSLSSAAAIATDDQTISVTVVSGILDCSRFLIDRILSNTKNSMEVGSVEDCSTLAMKIFDEIVLRLLRDCLLVCKVDNPDSQSEVLLPCSNLSIKNSYISSIFNQVSQMLNNLASSGNPLKLELFEKFQRTLISWLESGQTVDVQQAQPKVDESTVHRLLIGSVDPLRLIKFIDHLAAAAASSSSSSMSRKPNDPKSGDTPIDHFELIQPLCSDRFIDLFDKLLDIVKQSLYVKNGDETELNLHDQKSLHALVLLALCGYLPFERIRIRCFLKLLFGLLLAELPKELLSLPTMCWSSSVVFGLIKIWSLHENEQEGDLNSIDENHHLRALMDYDTSVIFYNYLFSLLLDYLLKLQNSSSLSTTVSIQYVFNNLKSIMCLSVKSWFDELVSATTPSAATTSGKESVAVSFCDYPRLEPVKIFTLLDCFHSLLNKSFQNRTTSIMNNNTYTLVIYSELVSLLSENLIRFFDASNCDNSFCSFFFSPKQFSYQHVFKLQIFATILIYLLELMNKTITTTTTNNNDSEQTSDIKEDRRAFIQTYFKLHELLVKMLIEFYHVNYYLMNADLNATLSNGTNTDGNNDISCNVKNENKAAGLVKSNARLRDILINGSHSSTCVDVSRNILSLSDLIARGESLILTSFYAVETVQSIYIHHRSNVEQLIQLLLQSVTLENQIVTPKFANFVLRFHSNLNKSIFGSCFSSIWLQSTIKVTNRFLQTIHDQLPKLPGRFSIPRYQLAQFGFDSSDLLKVLGSLARLHQLGLMLRLNLEFKKDDERGRSYLVCVGLSRVWMSVLAEPCNTCLDLGWPSSIDTLSVSSVEGDSRLADYESSSAVFDQNHRKHNRLDFELTSTVSFERKLAVLWYDLSSAYSLDKLVAIFEDDANCLTQTNDYQTCYSKILSTTCYALLLNKIVTIHPNYWPLDVKYGASCTDDHHHGESWADLHLIFNSSKMDYQTLLFNRCCEFYLPAGIVKRCLPRQELLGRLRSLTMCFSDNHHHLQDTKEAEQNRFTQANIAEMVSGLVSVRSTAPIYITTFCTIILNDFKTILTEIADSFADDIQPDFNSINQFRITISAMCFLECLLLLWQPWQWNTCSSNKYPISSRVVGLVQMSIWLKQLKPCLELTQWDFILCITISWLSTAVNYLDSSRSDLTSSHKLFLLFAFRAFRVATALGVIFIKRRVTIAAKDILSNDFNLIDRKKSSNISNELDENEFEDEEPINEFLNEADYTDQATENVKDQKELDDLLASDSLDCEDVEEPASDGCCPEDDFSDEDFASALAKGLPLIPRRSHPSSKIQNDFDNFFASHLYSSLLPIILKFCIPIDGHSKALPDCDSCIRAMCATFSTCPSNHLITALQEKPNLIMEYLVDFNFTKTQPVVIDQILKSANNSSSSINDFTLGYRGSLDMACKLMTDSPSLSGQLLGHILLNRLISIRIEYANNKSAAYAANHLVRRIPASWLSLLYGSSLSEPIKTYLSSDSAFDEWGTGSFSSTFLISPSLFSGWHLDCDSHRSLLGYLLSWDCLLSLMTCVGPQTRASLQESLLGSSANLFDRFMLIIGLLLPCPANMKSFIDSPSRLEPDERLLLINSTSRMFLEMALSCCSTRKLNRRPMNIIKPLASGDDREWKDAFSPDDNLMNLPGRRIASDINHFAVRLFRRFLAESPALMRKWYERLTSKNSFSTNDPLPFANRKPGRLRQLASVMNKIVSQYFSPDLARNETVLVQYRSYLRLIKDERDSSKSLFSLLKSTPTDHTVRIKCHPATHEVIAIYHISDDNSMEMLIQLPSDYPLGLATVTKGRGNLGSSWNIQLSLFINNHNGSILDGIDLWKRNVRKKFDGVEECSICYSVVHNTNFSLPKMQCHTCKKLFHHDCMYKWFTTSRNPACPLCRHLFLDPLGKMVSQNSNQFRH